MVKFSRFTHIFELDDAEVIALYHSLRMKPVYLSKDTFRSLQAWLASSFSKEFDAVPDSIRDEVLQLKRWKILTDKADEDDKVLEFVRSRIPQPAISVCYMILSEQCNLACKYCFLGNNDSEKRKHFNIQNMSMEMADKAINFFITQKRNKLRI